MNSIKRFFPLMALCLMLAGCGPKAVQKEIFAMDTVMTLTAYGEHAESGLNDAIAEINSAQRELDPELEGSAVWQINHAQGQPVQVSRFLYDMLQTAKEVYENSGSALDLTIYPAVKAWGFIDGQYAVPNSETLTELRPCVDFSAVSLWEEHDTCFVQLPAGAQLSFGAVAKGGIAQQITQQFASVGVDSAIISLGGNVQIHGDKPGGSNWNIAVQDPNDPAGRLGILSVGTSTGGAVVTSGSYQRYFEQDGNIYHHILDPNTLSPADSGLVSVTIICQNGTLADCLSTALFVLGEEGAVDYWHSYGGFDMLLVTTDGRVLLTENLHLSDRNENYQYQTIQ